MSVVDQINAIFFTVLCVFSASIATIIDSSLLLATSDSPEAAKLIALIGKEWTLLVLAWRNRLIVESDISI